MTMYEGYNKALRRVVMHNITQDQKDRMEQNPAYKGILRFDPVAAPLLEPVAVERKAKAEPAPIKQEGATAQPKGDKGE